ncbi:hypothetical protein OH781_40840 [Streptomyces sp. NBC_01550]|uniref:hypothetical protein n=1 Tax=Streptomyces sp. NBC_01550 TaxID=2975875 RepID=UPI003867A888
MLDTDNGTPGFGGAPVSNEMPPAELPVVDQVLAAALAAKGAPSIWALGLLRDARRASHCPAGRPSPHQDPLTLVLYVLKGQLGKPRKHHAHKLVDITHALSTTPFALRHHRK